MALVVGICAHCVYFTAPGSTGGSSGGSTGGPDLSLSLGKQQPQQQTPQRGVSAPTSPAKSRESLLQRVQSLTGAARDQGASIIGKIGMVLPSREST